MDVNEQIDHMITRYDDWRGVILTQLRALIHEADPNITEEWKWMTAVFAHDGLVCALGAFKDHVKINFFRGVALPDPHKVINGGLSSKEHRSIDFFEGNKINETAVKELVKAAVAFNAEV